VLEQEAVARRDDRSRRPHRLPQGEIPGHDREDDSERPLVDGNATTLPGVKLFRGEEAAAVLGIVLGRPGALLDLGFRLDDRLSHLTADRLCQLIVHRAELARDTGHQLGALAPWRTTLRGEGGVGEIERRVDPVVGEDLEGPDHLARGRVDRLHGGGTCGGAHLCSFYFDLGRSELETRAPSDACQMNVQLLPSLIRDSPTRTRAAYSPHPEFLLS
jgi:hypothetical protein